MVVRKFYIHHVCPWCNKGEVLADGKGKITLSVQCPKCGRFFTADMDKLKTERATAQRRTSRLR